MARRPTREVSKQPAHLSPDQMRAGIDRLGKLIERVKQFDPRTVTDQYDIPHVTQLSAAVDEVLVRTFGPDTLDYDRYKNASEFDNGPHNYAYKVPIVDVHRSLDKSKQQSIALLQQAAEVLQERLAEAPLTKHAADIQIDADNKLSRKVFVVHGHDEGAREAVARFLERIGFEPIILHEQANLGRTVIEKIEAHRDVGFAVVLLTPDDIGGPKDQAPSPRPRQNVIMELGYFIRHLGRERLCVLKRGGIEIPTDFAGVIWTPFDDAGAWKTALGKELQGVGFEIDWNKVMRS